MCKVVLLYSASQQQAGSTRGLSQNQNFVVVVRI